MYTKAFFLSLIGVVLLFTGNTHAQSYHTRYGTASFKVAAPAKIINGENKAVSIHINFKTGSISLETAIDSFTFHNNFVADTMNWLIKKRFNEYYMESNLYPEINYQGKITNTATIKYNKDGVYPIHTKGILYLHGVKQSITAEAILTVKGGHLSVNSEIVVVPETYKIRIPPYIGYMYFKEVNIAVQGDLSK